MKRHIKITIEFSDLDYEDAASVQFDSREPRLKAPESLHIKELTLVSRVMGMVDEHTKILPKSHDERDARSERNSRAFQAKQAK